MTEHVKPGMPLRDALRKAEEVGLQVRRKNRHGEFVISRPGLRPYTVHHGNRDAGKALASYINRNALEVQP